MGGGFVNNNNIQNNNLNNYNNNNQFQQNSINTAPKSNNPFDDLI